MMDVENEFGEMENIEVPTHDSRVRNWLRQLLEPMTLFGETAKDRRNRLRNLVLDMMQKKTKFEFEDSSDEDAQEVKQESYSYGIKDLKEARKNILQYSIKNAKDRLQSHRQELELPFVYRKKLRHEYYTTLNDFHTKSLQFGDDRPIGFCQFSPNSRLLGTASWTGLVKIWSVPDSENLMVLRGHRDRASGLDFHPKATFGQSLSTLNLASGSFDGEVLLWSLQSDSPLGSLDGHRGRVARLAFHPSGRFLGTASFDTTWKLWDLERKVELLSQDGHSREVFAIGFQNDGALVATGGYDSIGRVWDLRTGRTVMVLQKHTKSILSLDWSPCGYQVATGAEDNSIIIWDIRASNSIYTIPAHKSNVTQVKYWHANDTFGSSKLDSWNLKNGDEQMDIDQNHDIDEETKLRKKLLDGSFLISSSYDGTLKIWTDGDYKPLKSLSGLEGRLMSCDISSDGEYIAASLYDRTFKIFSKQKL